MILTFILFSFSKIFTVQFIVECKKQLRWIWFPKHNQFCNCILPFLFFFVFFLTGKCLCLWSSILWLWGGTGKGESFFTCVASIYSMNVLKVIMINAGQTLPLLAGKAAGWLPWHLTYCLHCSKETQLDQFCIPFPTSLKNGWSLMEGKKSHVLYSRLWY